MVEEDGQNFLIAIDQHAAHERIYLEKLVESSVLPLLNFFTYSFQDIFATF